MPDNQSPAEKLSLPTEPHCMAKALPKESLHAQRPARDEKYGSKNPSTGEWDDAEQLRTSEDALGNLFQLENSIEEVQQ